MQSTRRALLAAMLLATLLPSSEDVAAQLVRGKDYLLVDPPQPTNSGKKVEVIEFFWYGCGGCNGLQPSLRAWLKRKSADVEFRRVPAVLDSSWIPLTRAYYALDALELTDKLHHEVFAAIHEQKVRLQEPKVLFDWVASRGVDRKRFMDTYHSFGIQSRAQRSIDVTRIYHISSTPTLVVDGKYLTTPSMAGSYERSFKVLDEVIALARNTRAGKK